MHHEQRFHSCEKKYLEEIINRAKHCIGTMRPSPRPGQHPSQRPVEDDGCGSHFRDCFLEIIEDAEIALCLIKKEDQVRGDDNGDIEHHTGYRRRV
jgi:hypothetical protein